MHPTVRFSLDSIRATALVAFASAVLLTPSVSARSTSVTDMLSDSMVDLASVGGGDSTNIQLFAAPGGASDSGQIPATAVNPIVGYMPMGFHDAPVTIATNAIPEAGTTAAGAGVIPGANQPEAYAGASGQRSIIADLGSSSRTRGQVAGLAGIRFTSAMSLLRALFSQWTWLMAWRDSRTGRGRLLLFSLSISAGVGALVAVGSLGRNLRVAVEQQARALLGADLVIGSRATFSDEAEQLFRSLGGEQSRETAFSTMAQFPKTGATRLAQVRALSGGFPWYGEMKTTPPEAVAAFRAGEGVLVEENMLLQFDAAVGDELRLGNLTLPIVGALKQVPGEAIAFAALAPRVYVPAGELPKTGLVQAHSLVRYRVHFRLAASVDVEAIVKQREPQLLRLRLDVDTVARRKEDLGDAIQNLERFLNLGGFIALLLGAVGIASAIHVHVKQKIPHAAVLRCLGCAAAQPFAIYLAQGLTLGLVGSSVGVALGEVVQRMLPGIVAKFVPFPIPTEFAWMSALPGLAAGLLVCLLFTLLPLLEVRRVPPLAVLRAAFGGDASPRRDPWRWALLGLIGVTIFGFAITQAAKWTEGAGVAGGLLMGFGLLAGAAKLVIWLARRAVPSSAPFVWRQGLANLQRPNNRTLLMVLALGLGTFLLLTMHLLRDALLHELFPATATAKPNAILFDLQPDQRDGVKQLLDEQALPLLDEAPIVTMRLQSVKGRGVETLLADKDSKPAGWALRREYRSTWRTNLADSEELLAGQFVARVPPGTSPVPVSVEEGIAKELRVALGDELVFDVQGLPLAVRVASLRKVDWRQVRPNFFVVFPAGVLEDAPGFRLMATRVPDAAASARMQRALVGRFPNVSVIDLTLILQTLDGVLSKVGLVLRFMALFTVVAGVLVLTGAIWTSRWQRVQESVLLRTLGASRGQIRGILLVEFLALGFMASVTACLLAVGASWALAVFAFKAGYVFALWPVVVTAALVTTLTVVVGALSSRGVCDQPPLEVLRKDL